MEGGRAVGLATCHACGRPLDPGRAFCPYCGAAATTPCPHCGRAVKPGARFCPGCGRGLTATRAGAGPRPSIGGIPLPRGVGKLAAGGSLLVVAGSFLPWLSLNGVSGSAWQLSIAGLLTGHGYASGLTTGAVLLAALVVSLPYLTRRPLPPRTIFVVGAVASLAAGVAVIRGLTSDPPLGLGIGLVAVAAGGISLLVEDLRRGDAAPTGAVPAARAVAVPASCPQCGSPASGRFCASCGASIA